MALDVDTVIDRRRLTRRVAIWRGLAIVIAIASVAAFVATREGVVAGQHVARLNISGAMFAERPLLRAIERLRKDRRVAGVVVSIDSPGGTSVAGERTHDALRQLAEAKPMVTHIRQLGASAAYMAAIASDHVVAQRTSLTGSVGVLIQYAQATELLDNLGLQVSKVESGALKAEPFPFEPTSPEAVEQLQSVVDDTFEYFIDLVTERRSLSEAQVATISDGRIFTGAQALETDLVDALGGERTAIAWMEEERDLPTGLPVRDYRPSDDGDIPLVTRITDRVLERVAGAAGITLAPLPPHGSVDGLWSLWHGRRPSDV